MIKKIIQNIIRVVQNILVTLLLTMIYIVGIGITRICIVIFNRRILIAPHKDKETFWQKAEGYEMDLENSVRQS